MTYRKTNDVNSCDGTSFRGTLSQCGYPKMTKSYIEGAFGPCLNGLGDGKVDYEWVFFDDATGFVFTVYNYSDYIPVNQPYDWRIGGYGETPWRSFAAWFVQTLEDYYAGR